MTDHVYPIKALTDNYIWAIVQDNDVFVVDPGEASPVEQFLAAKNLRLKGILITHHHHDHTGGVLALKKATGACVYGPDNPKLADMVDYPVHEGDTVAFGQKVFNVLEVAGHTLDHLAYFIDLDPIRIFCGDTLFSCGSGRLFEGNSKQMVQSLDKFRKISDNSLLYSAHEYTLSNIRWAVSVDPHNQTLMQWQNEATLLRQMDKPTLPVSLRHELAVNPFLRLDVACIRQAAERYQGRSLSQPDEVFSALREWKNNF